MNAVRADPKQLRTPVHRCLGQVGSGLHASGGSVWGRRRKMDNMSATVIYMRQKLTNKTKSEFHTTSASALHDPKFAYLQYAWNLDSQNVVDGPRDEYQTDAPIANVEQKYADQSLSRRQKLIAIRLGTCLETDQYKSPKPRLCRKKEQGKKKKNEMFHLWNADVNMWSYSTCKNYWNLARHVAALPACRWACIHFGSIKSTGLRKKMLNVEGCCKWCSNLMCCNCVPAAFNMQPNHLWPIFLCKIVSFSPLSVVRNGGGCASFISTTAVLPRTRQQTYLLQLYHQWTNSWRERATTRISSAKRRCEIGPPSIKSMPPCPTACLHFRMVMSKTKKITVDWERGPVAHRLWSGIGHSDRHRRQLHHVVRSTPVKPKSSVEELLLKQGWPQCWPTCPVKRLGQVHADAPNRKTGCFCFVLGNIRW